MARGDQKVFAAFELNKGLGTYNMGSDVFKSVLITEAFAAVNANAATARLADYTQVASGGNYVAGETIANTTWALSGDTVALDGDDQVIAPDSENPQTGKCRLIYNDTSANKDLVKVIDLTADGSTAFDMRTVQTTFTENAAGIVQSQVNA